MTGEISLRSQALPIGSVKENVVAAIQAGIATVVLPARSRKDLDDVPEKVRKRVRFDWLERLEDAITAALNPSQAREPDIPKTTQAASTERRRHTLASHQNR